MIFLDGCKKLFMKQPSTEVGILGRIHLKSDHDEIKLAKSFSHIKRTPLPPPIEIPAAPQSTLNGVARIAAAAAVLFSIGERWYANGICCCAGMRSLPRLPIDPQPVADALFPAVDILDLTALCGFITRYH